MSTARTPGLRTFVLLWLGLTISSLGSQLTGFALGIWVYQRTGSVTLNGLALLANTSPVVLVGPFAGALVDRWNRRTALLVAQLGALGGVVALAALAAIDRLDALAVIVLVALNACFTAFQLPAFSASVTMLVPREQLGRASGLVQLGVAMSYVLAPAAGGALLQTRGLSTILLLDIASFFFAIFVLLLVKIPQPTAARVAQPAVWREALLALRYLRERPGLVALLLFVIAVNFNFGVVLVLFTPLVLGFADSRVLGVLVSVSGIGMLAGSVTMLGWGGPRSPVHGVLGFVLLQGLLFCLGAARPSAWLAGAGAFGVLFAGALVAGCSQTLWQRKVAPELQGRVFALRGAVSGASQPLAFLLAGPLCDRVAEPLMAPGGLLASTAGRILGTGPGRGAALIFVAMGCSTVASVIAGARYPRLRRVEDELPDHVAASESTSSHPR